MLTLPQQQQIKQKVVECINTIKTKYNIAHFPMPQIQYNLRGTCAGKANYVKWILQFHPKIASENWNDYINTTVPHEVAHLAVELVYPHAHHRGGKRSVHGYEWQSIMHTLGADPARCHSYNVANIGNRFHYKCSGCGADLYMTAKRHNKALAGFSYHHSKCGSVRGKVVFVGAPVQAKVVSVKTKAPEQGSNLYAAYEVYKAYHHRYNRSMMIKVFVNNVGLGYNTANTYYYKCKQMFEQGV